MEMYYSGATGGFYSPTVHPVIPGDAVLLAEDVYNAFKVGLEQGKQITIGEDGAPHLIDREEPREEVEANERLWRDSKLASTEWLTVRHRDELDMDNPTTLTPRQYDDLLMYRQTLRDWPQSEGFPDVAMRPEAPEWIIEVG